jgi:hypothetical protein
MPSPNCKLPDPATLFKNRDDEKIPAYIREAADFLASGDADHVLIILIARQARMPRPRGAGLSRQRRIASWETIRWRSGFQPEACNIPEKIRIFWIVWVWLTLVWGI